MSYCVHCGVELDSSLKSCPLCHTPVIDPNSFTLNNKTDSPYPDHIGKVEPVTRKDLFIFLSITLTSIALCCGLLNFLLFSKILWSIPVIGLCIFFAIVLLPATLFPTLNKFIILSFDTIALCIYIYMISFLTPTSKWYFGVALPIILIIYSLFFVFLLLKLKIQMSILKSFLYFIISIAILCISIELLLDHILNKSLSLSWSAVVLTVCTILSVILCTILSLRRIRIMIQKRFHL